MKKFLSILLSVILIISICPMGLFGITASAETGNITEFAGGSGTVDNPYLISNLNHFKNIKKFPSACFQLENNIYDLDVAILEFSGVLDGNGYSLINVNIDVNKDCCGIICINNGTIINLGLNSGIIKSKYISEYSEDVIRVGGIAGKNNGIIESCYSNITIDAYLEVYDARVTTQFGRSAYANLYLGGIAGENTGTIKNCYNSGFIYSRGFADTYGTGYTGCYHRNGGIVGDNRSGEVSYCYNVGKVETESIGGHVDYSSGIAGRNWSDKEINNCYFISEYEYGVGGIKNEQTTSCNSDQMKIKDNFAGWDFSGIWEIDDFYNYNFPQLKFARYEQIMSIQIENEENLEIIERIQGEIPEILLKINYIDGHSTQNYLDTSMINDFNNKLPGQQLLYIDYGGLQVPFSAKIKERSLSNIKINTLPEKLTYLEGLEELDLKGGTISLLYDNGETEQTSMDNTVIDGFDNNHSGKQKITVTYADKSCDFDIIVTPKELISIQIFEKPDKLTYLENKDALDLAGGKIKLFYNNGTDEIVEMTSAEVTGFDNSQIGKQTIVLKYNNFIEEFEIEIIERSILGITVSTLPKKIIYYEPDKELDLSGGVLTVIYNNDTQEYIAMNSNMVSNFNSQKFGEQDLTVKYLDFTTTFKISIIEREENTTEFAGGKGFDYSPYLVSTKEHLNNVRKYPDAYFKQLNDIEFTAADFASGGTYYNNGYGWMPIGKDSNSAFSGNYDGGGFSIKNLKVDITTANSAYGGLFGYCTGDLKNITIENSDIKVTASGTAYAGGIVGYHKNGTIENCHNNNTTVNAQYGGGIVGYSYYSDAINNCSNSGNVDGINTGGIVGYTYHTDTINNCSNSGKVDGTYVGGIVGTTVYLSSISDCTNTGDIIKSNTSGAYIGGIIGYNKSGTLDISDCSNSGEIYAEGTDLSSISLGGAPIVGGIVGYSYNTNIENCSNFANIYGDYAGGIIGYGNTIIRDALNIGNISARTNSGGIVGYHNDGSIYTSINKGNITGVRYVNGNIYTNYSAAVGGIIGAARNGSGIYECANLGTVSNGEYSGGIAGIGDYISQSYNNGTVNSVYYSGGICGDFLDSGSKILNCYNSGKVSGKYAAGLIATMEYGTVQISYNVGKISATESGGYVAAIIAYQTGGTVIDCYYFDDINIGVGYVDYSISNTPETTKLNKANMQNSSNFDGFDFDTIWTMDGNTDYPYPELRNVEMIYVPYVLGDIDGIDGVTDADAEYLLMFTFFPEDYPVNQTCDFNGDGKVNDADAEHLLMFTFFPEDYPLH